MSTETPRIAPLPRAEWTDAACDMFSYWEGAEARENGSRSNVMMTLANHPALGMAVMDMGKYVLTGSTLTPRQRELVVLRISWRFKSEYELEHHIHSARQIGFSDEDIAAIQQDGVSSSWDADDALFITAIDELSTSGKIGGATWRALSERMDRHRLMDLMYTVGFITMNAWAFATIGIEVEDDFKAFAKAPEEMAKKR